jgi:hypothetical protein
MRRLQTAALLIGLICIIFAVLSPRLDDPVLILKSHPAHVTSRTGRAHGRTLSTIMGPAVVALQRTALQFITIITQRDRFSALHNHTSIELTCTWLC